MADNFQLRPYLIRLLIVVAISVVLTAAFNEGSYWLQKDKYDRAPKTIQLVIPAGTAERVAAGEDVPAIPKEMVFVLGDTLEVKNEDNATHQLGPIFVPPGTTGSLIMEQAENLAYSCSFATSRYLGLDIRQPTTFGTRVTALAIAAPTTAVLLYLYSLLVFPVKSSTEAKLKQHAAS